MRVGNGQDRFRGCRGRTEKTNVGVTENLAAMQLEAYAVPQKQHILMKRSTFIKWERRLDPQPHSQRARRTMRKVKTTPQRGFFPLELTVACVGAGPAVKLCYLQVSSHPKFYLPGYILLIH